MLLAEDALLDSMINFGGWTVMICSIGAVITLMSFCLYQVLLDHQNGDD